MAESIVERMRRQAFASTKRDVHYEEEQLTTETTVCPGCGAGRAEEHGVKECRYCGYQRRPVAAQQTTHFSRRIEGHYGAISPDDYRITGTP